jgi:ribosomal 30S subunit maturation factor RimM
LEPHQFYYHELVGYQVVNPGVEESIRVKDVLDRPGQPLLELLVGEEGRVVFIPCVDPFIERMDRDARVLYLTAPHELYFL